MAGTVDPSNLAASFLTLTALEIVLGIDNVVFISILAGKLPPEQRQKATQIGLAVALVSRIILLFCISWVVKLTAPLFNLGPMEISGRDLILLGGGLFLIYKATKEIFDKLEGHEHTKESKGAASFWGVIGQIVLIDVIFSLDSVITAVGMASDLGIMIAAVVISLAIMLFFAGRISKFVEDHPSVKILCLAFLILIGTNLVAEGLGQHIEKGFTYAAMAFSTFVEFLNLRYKAKQKPKAE
jgi:predicted tellurium resistance membrane protein TerC